MKILSQHEIQTVSGGWDEVFLAACVAGKLNYNLYGTVGCLALIEMVIHKWDYSSWATWQLPKDMPSAFVNATIGAIAAFVGYDIGSHCRSQSSTAES